MKWKIVEQRGGTLCALASGDARGRPGHGETLIWEGEATDNSDALLKAGKEVPIELGPYGYRLKGKA